MKRFMATLVAALALVLPASANGHHNPNHWKWGWNNMSASVNPFIYSGSAYWDDQFVDKAHGPTVLHGFGPSQTCNRTMAGQDWWYGYPSDLGCGGYITNAIQHWSGAGTSYLYIDSWQ